MDNPQELQDAEARLARSLVLASAVQREVAVLDVAAWIETAADAALAGELRVRDHARERLRAGRQAIKQFKEQEEKKPVALSLASILEDIDDGMDYEAHAAAPAAAANKRPAEEQQGEHAAKQAKHGESSSSTAQHHHRTVY